MKKILFVDDEPNVLSAVQRQLHNLFDVETASDPVAALALLQKKAGYSVVVADMGMPIMSGVEFLAKAAEVSPDTVRIMLTGYLNQSTAAEAVNQGGIFRFLNKPCSTEKLVQTLEAAVARYQLLIAERDLLQNTLGGILKVLSEILALAEPKTFGQAEALRDSVRRLAASLKVNPTWDLEAAAQLSQIGSITIPPELILKARRGQPLTDAEEEVFNDIPSVGSSLLAQIPRLEGVARIVLYQHKNFDGSGFPDDNVAGETIPLGARMLRLLVDLAQLESGGLQRPAAIQQLRARAGRYDPRLLQTLEPTPGAAATARAETPLAAAAIVFADLRVGHILRGNLETKDNILLVTAGNKITPMLMHRLRNFASLYGIHEPIFIEETGAPFFHCPDRKPSAP